MTADNSTTRLTLGHRGKWRTLLKIAAVAGAAELAIAFPVAHILFSGSAALAADITVTTVTVLLWTISASPLWGSVVIDDKSVRIRFGVLADIAVPRASIVSVEVPEDDDASKPPVGVEFSATDGRARLVFSDRGLVTIALASAAPGRIFQNRQLPIRSLVLTTSDSERLVTLLSPPS